MFLSRVANDSAAFFGFQIGDAVMPKILGL